jgi:oxygen-dependent protoporphyrinogen oxidase
MPDVVVIGGGISGLACALNIVDRRPDLSLRVLEASHRLGGTIRTDRTNGWICEAGPGAYIDRDPSTRRLIERLGLTSEVVAAGNALRKRYIRHDGALHLYPDSPTAVACTNLLSEKGRKRMLLAPVRPALSENADWSVNEFARAHLGLEAAQMLLDPIVGGIYAGDARKLSAASVLPQLVELARRGGRVCDALVGQGQGRVGKGSMVSLATGLGRLIEALAVQLGDRIELGRPVRSIVRNENTWWVHIAGDRPEPIRADAVVFTPHGRIASTCLGPLHRDLPPLLEAIASPPVMVVNLGYAPGAIQHALDGFGYLVPSTEGGSVLGMKWTTSIFPTGRAPADHVLLQVFIGGSRDPSIGTSSEAELVEQARAEVAQTLGATADPTHVRVFAHRSGIPQYTVGHAERVQRIEAALAELPGLYLGGTTLHGVGINACTTAAERLAEDVARALPMSRLTRSTAVQRLSIV